MGSFTRLTYHIIFGTKFRRKMIRNEIAKPLYEYIGGTIRNRKGRLIQIGGVEDHLHLLVGLPPTITVSDAVRDIKANGSKWINENRVDTRNLSEKFEWQIGYGAFTVSYSNIAIVQNYIATQRETATIVAQDGWMQFICGLPPASTRNNGCAKSPVGFCPLELRSRYRCSDTPVAIRLRVFKTACTGSNRR